jgi:hypothetical protein
MEYACVRSEYEEKWVLDYHTGSRLLFGEVDLADLIRSRLTLRLTHSLAFIAKDRRPDTRTETRNQQRLTMAEVKGPLPPTTHQDRLET